MSFEPFNLVTQRFHVAKNLSTYLSAKAEESKFIFMRDSLDEIVSTSSAEELKEKENELAELKKVLEITPDNSKHVQPGMLEDLDVAPNAHEEALEVVLVILLQRHQRQ